MVSEALLFWFHSYFLMNTSESEFLEKVYREVVAIRVRLDAIEKLIVPEVKVGVRELRLIRRRREEAKRGKVVPWDEVKREIEESQK